MDLADCERTRERLTRILGILGAHIIITSVQDILVHERGTGCDLSEERDLDGLSNLDTLALLHEDLASVLAPILSIERWHTVLLGMVALLERLERGHQVMTAGHTVGDNPLGDTCGDGALDYCGDGIHGTDDLGLELGRDVELDLLEEVL
jgi:hypothetical protein